MLDTLKARSHTRRHFWARAKEDFENGALPAYTVHFHGPFMGAHDSPDRRQSETAASEFCREKRIEDAFNNAFIDAATVIANLQKNVLAWFDFGNGALDLFRIKILYARAHYNSAMLVHSNRFGSVDHEVHDDLLNLAGVRLNGRQRLRKLEL